MFPFFLVSDLQFKGIFNKEEANKLFIEGRIKVRMGMNSKLIEYVPANKDGNQEEIQAAP